MGVLTVSIPKSKYKIKKQIKALEMLLESDTREEDIINHSMALNSLRKALKEVI